MFIYKKSNKRKKYGAYGLRFARILESVIFVSYISADFLPPVRKWINQKWITTSKGPCDRNIRFISEGGYSVCWSKNCSEFPLSFNTVLSCSDIVFAHRNMKSAQTWWLSQPYLRRFVSKQKLTHSLITKISVLRTHNKNLRTFYHKMYGTKW